MSFFFGSDIGKSVQKAGKETPEQVYKEILTAIGHIESLEPDRLHDFMTKCAGEMDGSAPKWDALWEALADYAEHFHIEVK